MSLDGPSFGYGPASYGFGFGPCGGPPGFAPYGAASDGAVVGAVGVGAAALIGAGLLLNRRQGATPPSEVAAPGAPPSGKPGTAPPSASRPQGGQGASSVVAPSTGTGSPSVALPPTPTAKLDAVKPPVVKLPAAAPDFAARPTIDSPPRPSAASQAAKPPDVEKPFPTDERVYSPIDLSSYPSVTPQAAKPPDAAKPAPAGEPVYSTIDLSPTSGAASPIAQSTDAAKPAPVAEPLASIGVSAASVEPSTGVVAPERQVENFCGLHALNAMLRTEGLAPLSKEAYLEEVVQTWAKRCRDLLDLPKATDDATRERREEDMKAYLASQNLAWDESTSRAYPQPKKDQLHQQGNAAALSDLLKRTLPAHLSVTTAGDYEAAGSQGFVQLKPDLSNAPLDRAYMVAALHGAHWTTFVRSGAGEWHHVDSLRPTSMALGTDDARRAVERSQAARPQGPLRALVVVRRA